MKQKPETIAYAVELMMQDEDLSSAEALRKAGIVFFDFVDLSQSRKQLSFTF